MNYTEYINNPMGAKNSVMSHRKMYEDLYQDKWKQIMVRENGKVDFTLYKDKDSYYCHLKIPSEVVANFYYDVVIRMIPEKDERRLNNCEVQFFSNDPSFSFSFAHAFVKHKMHIKDLESKMSKKSIKNTAKERNPEDTIGYVKSLFFAYIVMSQKGLFARARYDAEANKYDKKLFLSNIKDTDTCIEERQQQGQEIADAKRKAKKAVEARQPVEHSGSLVHPEVSPKFTTRTKTTKTTKSTIRTTRTTKVVGKRGR